MRKRFSEEQIASYSIDRPAAPRYGEASRPMGRLTMTCRPSVGHDKTG